MVVLNGLRDRERGCEPPARYTAGDGFEHRDECMMSTKEGLQSAGGGGAVRGLLEDREELVGLRPRVGAKADFGPASTSFRLEGASRVREGRRAVRDLGLLLRRSGVCWRWGSRRAGAPASVSVAVAGLRGQRTLCEAPARWR